MNRRITGDPGDKTVIEQISIAAPQRRFGRESFAEVHVKRSRDSAEAKWGRTLKVALNDG